MFTLQDVVENIPINIAYAATDWKTRQVKRVVAGDLMSDILVSVETDNLLITSLATEQAIRTADIVCAVAVILVNDKLPSQAMKALAEESDITLLCTALPMYETCAALGDLAIRLNLMA